MPPRSSARPRRGHDGRHRIAHGRRRAPRRIRWRGTGGANGLLVGMPRVRPAGDGARDMSDDRWIDLQWITEGSEVTWGALFAS